MQNAVRANALPFWPRGNSSTKSIPFVGYPQFLYRASFQELYNDSRIGLKLMQRKGLRSLIVLSKAFGTGSLRSHWLGAKRLQISPNLLRCQVQSHPTLPIFFADAKYHPDYCAQYKSTQVFLLFCAGAAEQYGKPNPLENRKPCKQNVKSTSQLSQPEACESFHERGALVWTHEQ